MTIEQLTQKFNEIYQGSPWHGSSLKGQLSDIPTGRYTGVVGPSKKSIAHLLEHMLAWRQMAIEILKGNKAYDITLNSTMDWPEPNPEGDPKVYYLSKLEESQKELLTLLGTKSEDWLKEQTPNKNYQNQFLLQGIVEHDLYHSGQIGIFNSLLKD